MYTMTDQNIPDRPLDEEDYPIPGTPLESLDTRRRKATSGPHFRDFVGDAISETLVGDNTFVRFLEESYNNGDDALLGALFRKCWDNYRRKVVPA